MLIGTQIGVVLRRVLLTSMASGHPISVVKYLLGRVLLEDKSQSSKEKGQT